MTETFALLDREHLQAMTGGDNDLAVEVIEIFRHQAEIWSRMLDPHAEASQWADAAHTLKGASLGIGAILLASKCEKAEKAGRSETPQRHGRCSHDQRYQGCAGGHARRGRPGALRVYVVAATPRVIAAELVRNATVNQGPPDRLGDGRRQARAFASSLNLCHDIFDPRAVMHFRPVRLDTRRSIHEGLALCQDFDEQTINPVDLITNIGHGFSRLG